MIQGQPLRRELAKKVYGQLLVFTLVLCILFFLPAGTFAYWEGWVYLAILFIPALLVSHYLLLYDPELLERRMRMKEREPQQKLIMKLGYLYFLVTFLLPGFDKRFGWSHVSTRTVIIADIVVLLGYSIFVLVIKENRYASRTIEVEQGQKVISTGPYAIVRHPMYVGVLLLYLPTPLALGSYWGMIPSVLIIPILVARIRNEERVLLRDLMGYQEYMQKTRYRLIPHIW